ncbi:MAG: beta-ketoacyl-ACP synthase [Methylococcaceae bacterium]|nr:beta-ketoacyl-ACP synthase [Methylococcaceae bacterium]
MNRNPINAVAVSAFSAAFAGGLGRNTLYRALLDNESALGPLTLFPLPFTSPVGEYRESLPVIRPELRPYDSRNARLALSVIDFPEDGLRVAIRSASERYGPERVGVVIGTSTSGLYETEAAYEILLRDNAMPLDFYFLSRHAYQATPRFLQLELGLEGPCYAVSTACSSGAKAIAAGHRLIRNGICDAVLAGGVDTLCRLTLRGFHSLELISESPCRPMDKNRRGINIGEAAGLLLLEKIDAGTDFPFQVLAVGESSDAYHMSSPHPDGLGALSAMQHALQIAGLEPAAIDYLNLHATATEVNDRVEAKAVSRIFGDRLPVSGTKGITGHTLGAAGALECVISLLALEHGFVPGTSGLRDLDPECRCNVVWEPFPEQGLRTVMSNSFGFGGNNASLIVARNR